MSFTNKRCLAAFFLAFFHIGECLYCDLCVCVYIKGTKKWEAKRLSKKLFNTLLNKTIKVDRGGPESREGKLLGVEDDFIVFLTEDDGVVYYKTQHIKSITEQVTNSNSQDLELPEGFQFVAGKNFPDVLGKLRYNWVKINRGGPEALEGVLDEMDDGFVTVICGEEVIRVSLYHIRNISYGLKLNNDEETEKKEE